MRQMPELGNSRDPPPSTNNLAPPHPYLTSVVILFWLYRGNACTAFLPFFFWGKATHTQDTATTESFLRPTIYKPRHAVTKTLPLLPPQPNTHTRLHNFLSVFAPFPGPA